MPPHSEANRPPQPGGGRQLTDAGPIAAIVDSNDHLHDRTLEAWAYLPQATPLLTTWPCLTEALQLAQRTQNSKERRIYRQGRIIDLCRHGRIHIHYPEPEEFQRVLELLEKFQGRPISLADASLVAAAETLNLTQVFTYDSDFRFYTMRNGEPLEMYPQDFLIK